MTARKQKRRRCGTALQTTLRLQAAYRVLAFSQAPFEFVFWLIEQRKATLQDCIENERRPHQ